MQLFGLTLTHTHTHTHTHSHTDTHTLTFSLSLQVQHTISSLLMICADNCNNNKITTKGVYDALPPCWILLFVVVAKGQKCFEWQKSFILAEHIRGRSFSPTTFSNGVIKHTNLIKQTCCQNNVYFRVCWPIKGNGYNEICSRVVLSLLLHTELSSILQCYTTRRVFWRIISTM